MVPLAMRFGTEIVAVFSPAGSVPSNHSFRACPWAAIVEAGAGECAG
jgi:hypothetical protein